MCLSYAPSRGRGENAKMIDEAKKNALRNFSFGNQIAEEEREALRRLFENSSLGSYLQRRNWTSFMALKAQARVRYMS